MTQDQEPFFVEAPLSVIHVHADTSKLRTTLNQSIDTTVAETFADFHFIYTMRLWLKRLKIEEGDKVLVKMQL